MNALLSLSHLFRGEAYLDPGSGSFILQLILAGLLGSLFVFRSSWSKIKTFFKEKFSRKQDKDE
ncbi:MAG: hypothetical protein AB1345_14460 [Chloroflexota bacterium]